MWLPFRKYSGSNETQLELDREPPTLAYDRIYKQNAALPAAVDLGSVAEAYQEVARRLGILPEGGPRDFKASAVMQ